MIDPKIGPAQYAVTTDDGIEYTLVPTEAYNQLKSDLRLLEALQGAGVDNWDGYDVAIEMLDS
jgi:hypothetical protein